MGGIGPAAAGRCPPRSSSLDLAIAGVASQHSVWLAGFVGAALLFIMNLGYWQPMLETLSLVSWRHC